MATPRARSPQRVVDPLTAAPAPPIAGHGLWIGLGVILAVVVSWEVVLRAGWLSAPFLPPPTAILRTLAGSLRSGEMLLHVRATMLRVLAGVLLGGTGGLLLGLAMGWWRELRAGADPVVAALHPIPKLALLPLFMLLFGLGETSKIVVVSLGAFFPMLLNTMAGVRQISPVHFDVARSYGASPRQMLFRVLLPGSLPMVLIGLRLAANVAFLSAIAVEMVMADTGLGSLLWLSWQVLRIELLYASLVVIALLGVGLNAVLNWVAWRGAPWLTERQVTV